MFKKKVFWFEFIGEPPVMLMNLEMVKFIKKIESNLEIHFDSEYIKVPFENKDQCDDCYNKMRKLLIG